MVACAAVMLPDGPLLTHYLGFAHEISSSFSNRKILVSDSFEGLSSCDDVSSSFPAPVAGFFQMVVKIPKSKVRYAKKKGIKTEYPLWRQGTLSSDKIGGSSQWRRSKTMGKVASTPVSSKLDNQSWDKFTKRNPIIIPSPINENSTSTTTYTTVPNLMSSNANISITGSHPLESVTVVSDLHKRLSSGRRAFSLPSSVITRKPSFSEKTEIGAFEVEEKKNREVQQQPHFIRPSRKSKFSDTIGAPQQSMFFEFPPPPLRRRSMSLSRISSIASDLSVLSNDDLLLFPNKQPILHDITLPCEGVAPAGEPFYTDRKGLKDKKRTQPIQLADVAHTPHLSSLSGLHLPSAVSRAQRLFHSFNLFHKPSKQLLIEGQSDPLIPAVQTRHSRQMQSSGSCSLSPSRKEQATPAAVSTLSSSFSRYRNRPDRTRALHGARKRFLSSEAAAGGEFDTLSDAEGEMLIGKKNVTGASSRSGERLEEYYRSKTSNGSDLPLVDAVGLTPLYGGGHQTNLSLADDEEADAHHNHNLTTFAAATMSIAEDDISEIAPAENETDDSLKSSSLLFRV